MATETNKTEVAGKTATAKTAERPRGLRRKLIGIVTSDKMNKTRVVTVTRRVSHKAYAKYVTQRIRYKAHDERNEFKTGDKVEIIESKPISRDKRWRIERLVQRAEEA